ncbi:hypothetical protein AB0395_18280 [Streptosporangium sp. NPDC051023]|uniref:aromatic-ring hydroxylase C-terminal domain-containing protein n=1 Tax=Streptosporangium sp. NPDC051023 TaxID=3155410 RepID=UPI00344C3CFC
MDHQRIGDRLRPHGPGEFLRAFGLSRDGATLIRPDGYIAWRSRDLPIQPADTLTAALGQVSFATRHATASRTQPSPDATSAGLKHVGGIAVRHDKLTAHHSAVSIACLLRRLR